MQQFAMMAAAGVIVSIAAHPCFNPYDHSVAALAVCTLYIEGQCMWCAQIEEDAEPRWAYDAEWDDPVSGTKTAFTLLHWPRSSEAELVSVALSLMSQGPPASTCKNIQISIL